jgi:hypothetical protein
MSFLDPLRDTTTEHWKDASAWLLYTLVGSLAPIWLGWLILSALSRHPSIVDFSHHGEFALYSAAMFTPTLYIMLKDVRQIRFPWRTILVLLAFTGTGVAAGFFSVVTTVFMLPPPLLKLDDQFVQTGTVYLFCFSVVLSFLVTVLDNARQAPDITKIAAAQRQNLGDRFDKLGGGR